LAGKVVAGPCMMSLPPCVLYRVPGSRSRTHGAAGESPAGAIDTGMKTFHEWLAERMKNEGLWLNYKNAVVGMSNINPLLQKKAKLGVKIGHGTSSGNGFRTSARNSLSIAPHTW